MFFNDGGRQRNHLHPKVMVNQILTEMVSLSASVNQLMEEGSLQHSSRLIDKKYSEPIGELVSEPTSQIRQCRTSSLPPR
jgi:hypothetical protein